VLAAVCVGVSLACIVLPSAMRENAAAALRTTVVAPLASLQARAEQSRRAFQTRDAAVHVADSVTLRSQRLTGVESENERLRRLLGLGAALRWGFVPAEVLQGRGLGDEFTVTLSVGRDAGVELLAPVVAPEGIVGMVERVDRSFSLAILWPHPEFRVSAMAADESAYGIVSSHPSSGAARYLLELRSVPMRTPLKAGASIVSSGLGGVFPRGIPVGTVVSEMRTAEGITRSYLLRPVVRLSDIASVMVLRAERVKAGVAGVWQVGASADSAAKGVVSGADSIAKASAHPDSGRKP
jgi:rod shape-determining protein MreC